MSNWREIRNSAKDIRKTLETDLDSLEFISFSQGFEAAIDYVDIESDRFHNEGRTHVAEILRELAHKMRGEE